MILGLVAVISGAGNIIAQHMNYGEISEYGVILQILVGGLMASSSICLIKGRRMARDVLEGALWLALLGSLGWVTAQEHDFRNILALAMLQLWIPLGLLIYGVRKKTVRLFVNGT